MWRICTRRYKHSIPSERSQSKSCWISWHCPKVRPRGRGHAVWATLGHRSMSWNFYYPLPIMAGSHGIPKRWANGSWQSEKTRTQILREWVEPGSNQPLTNLTTNEQKETRNEKSCAPDAARNLPSRTRNLPPRPRQESLSVIILRRNPRARTRRSEAGGRERLFAMQEPGWRVRRSNRRETYHPG